MISEKHTCLRVFWEGEQNCKTLKVKAVKKDGMLSGFNLEKESVVVLSQLTK
jgi:hypothetical protein